MFHRLIFSSVGALQNRLDFHPPRRGRRNNVRRATDHAANAAYHPAGYHARPAGISWGRCNCSAPSDCRQSTKSLAEFAARKPRMESEDILDRNSFLGQNTAHGAHCASKASAGSGVRLSQLRAQRSGSELKGVDFVDTLWGRCNCSAPSHLSVVDDMQHGGGNAEAPVDDPDAV